MNILLIILLVIGSLIAILLIIALLTKKGYSIESEIIINRDPAEVFEYARLLKNQEKNNVWLMKDPNIQIIYTGTDGTVGATAAWKSDNKHVGIGEQEIKKIHEGESFDIEMRFKKPFEDTCYTQTTVKDAGNGQTLLHARFYGRNEFPRNLINIMMEIMLGKDMQQNLQNMKNDIEK